MSQPVTTNPFIIMLINMTVVFLVLIALGFVIKLIHKIDPTVHHEKEKTSAPEPAAAPAAATPEQVVEGVSPEVVAVIAAAVASCGYSVHTIHAIRPLERRGWKQSGRDIIAGRQI